MAQDWDAVAKAITARMEDLQVTQQQVAAAASVSLTTLRELQHNISPRRRRPQTLAAVSTALKWPSRQLQNVLEQLPTVDGPAGTDDAGRLARIEADLEALRERVDAVERAQRSG